MIEAEINNNNGCFGFVFLSRGVGAKGIYFGILN